MPRNFQKNQQEMMYTDDSYIRTVDESTNIQKKKFRKTQPQEMEDRALWLDVLRLTCTYAVCAMHINRSFDLHPTDLNIGDSYHAEIMTRMHMQMGIPLFMSVAGFTFAKILRRDFDRDTECNVHRIEMNCDTIVEMSDEKASIKSRSHSDVNSNQLHCSMQTKNHTDSLQKEVLQNSSTGTLKNIYSIMKMHSEAQWTLFRKRFVKLIGLGVLGLFTVVPIEKFYAAKYNGFEGGFATWILQRSSADWLNIGVVWFLFVLFGLWAMNWRIAFMWIFQSQKRSDLYKNQSTHEQRNCTSDMNPSKHVKPFWKTIWQHIDWKGLFIQELLLFAFWILFNLLDWFVFSKGGLRKELVAKLPNMDTRINYNLEDFPPPQFAKLFFRNAFIMYHIMWAASVLRGHLRSIGKSRALLSIITQGTLILNQIVLFYSFDPSPSSASPYRVTVHTLLHIFLYLNAYFLFGFQLCLHDCIVYENPEDAQEFQATPKISDSLSNFQVIGTIILLPVTPLIIPEMGSGFISQDRTYLNPLSRIFYEIGCFYWLYWFYAFFSTHCKRVPPKYEKVWKFLYGGQLYLYLVHSVWIYIVAFYMQKYYYYIPLAWKYAFLQICIPVLSYATYGVLQYFGKLVTRLFCTRDRKSKHMLL